MAKVSGKTLHPPIKEICIANSFLNVVACFQFAYYGGGVAPKKMGVSVRQECLGLYSCRQGPAEGHAQCFPGPQPSPLFRPFHRSFTFQGGFNLQRRGWTKGWQGIWSSGDDTKTPHFLAVDKEQRSRVDQERALDKVSEKASYCSDGYMERIRGVPIPPLSVIT